MNLTESQRRELEMASGREKQVTFEYPDTGTERKGTIVGEVSSIISHYKNVIQRIRLNEPHEDGSKFVYRFAYYVYSAKANGVVWAQRPLVLSSQQCQDLFAKARKERDDFPG
jgi:hypothetical protein